MLALEQSLRSTKHAGETIERSHSTLSDGLILLCSRLTEGFEEELVIEGQEKAQASWVALTPATPLELAVKSRGGMHFGADDMESSQLGDAIAQFDIRPASCHVGRFRVFGDAPTVR